MEKIVTKIEATAMVIPQRKRVAAYARVSTGTVDMLHSLAAQVKHYNQYIRAKSEWEHAGVYADADETGTKDSRSEFQRLLADCRVGKIDMVITKSISRFARNTVTLLETVRELKDLGIDVLFEEQKIHSISGDGELMLAILAGYAQEESRASSDNIKWRKRNDMKTGKTIPVKIYGYDVVNGKLVINPEQAAVVRQMYDLLFAGLGTPAIGKKLDAQGITSPMEGKKWESCVIYQLLINPKMCGDVLHQRRFVLDHISKKEVRNNGELPKYYFEGTHEGIVSKETFEAAKAEFARRAAIGGQRGTEGLPFKSKMVCEKCGKNYQRRPNAYRGKIYGEWICWGRKSKLYDCNESPVVRERTLLLAATKALGLDEFNAEIFAEKVERIIAHHDSLQLTFIFYDGMEVTVAYKKYDKWREVAIIGKSNGNSR